MPHVRSNLLQFPLEVKICNLRRQSLGVARENTICRERTTIRGKKTDRETAARIKKSKKTSAIKFKIRCQKHLYTLVLKDNEKAEKLKQSLPPSTFLQIDDIGTT